MTADRFDRGRTNRTHPTTSPCRVKPPHTTFCDASRVTTHDSRNSRVGNVCQKTYTVTPETLKPGRGGLHGSGSGASTSGFHPADSAAIALGITDGNKCQIMDLGRLSASRDIRKLWLKTDPLYGYRQVNTGRSILRRCRWLLAGIAKGELCQRLIDKRGDKMIRENRFELRIDLERRNSDG